MRQPLIAIHNNHLRPEDDVVTEGLIRNFQNNSLEPVLFERLDSIILSKFKIFL